MKFAGELETLQTELEQRVNAKIDDLVRRTIQLMAQERAMKGTISAAQIDDFTASFWNEYTRHAELHHSPPDPILDFGWQHCQVCGIRIGEHNDSGTGYCQTHAIIDDGDGEEDTRDSLHISGEGVDWTFYGFDRWNLAYRHFAPQGEELYYSNDVIRVALGQIEERGLEWEDSEFSLCDYCGRLINGPDGLECDCPSCPKCDTFNMPGAGGSTKCQSCGTEYHFVGGRDANPAN